MENKPKEEVKTEVVEKKEIMPNITEISEIRPAVKPVEKQDSPFTDVDDTFEVEVEYYKIGNKFIVKGIDEDYNTEENRKTSKLTATFRYPNTGDYSTIRSMKTEDKMDLSEILMFELRRLLVLIKKWSLDVELNNDNIYRLNVKITKSLLSQIQLKIAFEGII